MDLHMQTIKSTARTRLYAFSLSVAAALCGTFLTLSPVTARAELQVGTTVENPTLRDGSDKETQLPSFGDKTLLILYTDPDEADQNDPFADTVKKLNLDKGRFQSIGIANMEDAPAKPNWAIRMIVRGKVKKYGVTILTDPTKMLPKAWDLGDCNDKSVVIIVDPSKKVLFFKKGRLSAEDQNAAISILTKLAPPPPSAAN